jgi:hypothetical protein
MLSFASCCASDLASCVVGHAAAGFAAEDRRDDDDGAAAARPHRRHHQPGGANGREQRLVEGLLPLGVGGRHDVAAARQRHVVDEHVDTPETRDGGVDHVADTRLGRKVGLHRQHLGPRRRDGRQIERRFRERRFATA